MRRLILILAFIAVCWSASAQSFIIEDGKITWQKVYNTDLSHQEIIKSLYASNHCSDIIVLDSSFVTGVMRPTFYDCKAYDISYMRSPMYITQSLLGPAHFVLQIKDNRYRVTLQDIRLTSSDTSYSNTQIESVAFIDGELSGDFRRMAIPMYHDILSRIFTLTKIDDEW